MKISPKVAIYYDWLNQWGGAERVLLDILTLYPEADLYTLDYQAQNTSWLPKTHKIFSLNLKNKLFYTPFYSYRLEQIDFSSYDILISTTSNVGHSFLTSPNTLYLCYFHNINRYLYQHSPTILKPLLNYYQKLDKIFSQRPDYLFCNSKNVQDRIFSKYQRLADIIYPGINTQKFVPNNKKPDNYFLIVSRLVAHKKIDLVIDTFKTLPYKLKIVGQGRDQEFFKCLASSNKNIEFIESVDDQELVYLYQNSLGLIYPQEEDFGLTSLESQSCGRGVIAFNRGGARETIIDHKTGIFFDKQDVSSLKEAINSYLSSPPKSIDCRHHALNFDHQFFMLNFKKKVENLYAKVK